MCRKSRLLARPNGLVAPTACSILPPTFRPSASRFAPSRLRVRSSPMANRVTSLREDAKNDDVPQRRRGRHTPPRRRTSHQPRPFRLGPPGRRFDLLPAVYTLPPARRRIGRCFGPATGSSHGSERCGGGRMPLARSSTTPAWRGRSLV